VDISTAERQGLALLALIILPFAGAALYPAATRLRFASQRPWLPAFFILAIELVAVVVGLSRAWATLEIVRFAAPWVPRLGANIVFRADGLALVYGLLVSGIGLAIVGYSARYIPHHREEHQSAQTESGYYMLLSSFIGSMLGLVCADDLFTLYSFWEATSVTSYLLIAFDMTHGARRAALKAFAITAGAGLLLFAAFVAIFGATRQSTLSALMSEPSAADSITASGLAPLVTLGVVIGTFAKSAQAPLHVWLPDAMIAPTPVSAYLHSATMVAAGVFLMARLAPLLSALAGFDVSLVIFGAFTMVLGAATALSRHKLKAVLAYSTISQYGYVTLLIGLGAQGAAMFYIAGHAVIKAGLFLVAGAVIFATGRDDLRGLGGLRRGYPVLAATGCALSLSLAGVIPSSGFWMKELFYRSVYDTTVPWLMATALIGGALTIAYMLRFYMRIFFGRARARGREGEGHMISLLVPIAALAAITLFIGFAPSVGTRFTDMAASAAAARPVETHAELHFPPDEAMWMSLATFVLGVGLHAWISRWERARAARRALPRSHEDRRVLAEARANLSRFGIAALADAALSALTGLGRFAGRIHTGKLLHYLLALALVPVALGIALFSSSLVDLLVAPGAPSQLNRHEGAFLALSVAAVVLSFSSTVVRSQLGAVLMVSGVGFVLAAMFAALRAPDVALVQVTVETITGVVTLLVISRVRKVERERVMGRKGRRSRAARAAAAAAAAALGLVVSVLVLAVSGAHGDALVGETYLRIARSTGARDVVTAVLVDFRGLDTLGEITVFIVGVLGTTLLLSNWRKNDHERRGA